MNLVNAHTQTGANWIVSWLPQYRSCLPKHIVTCLFEVTFFSFFFLGSTVMMMLIMSHLHRLLLLQRQPPHLPHGHQQLPPPLSQRKQNPLDVLLLPFLSHALPHRILTHLKKHDTKKKGKHHTNRQILRSVVEVGLPLQEWEMMKEAGTTERRKTKDQSHSGSCQPGSLAPHLTPPHHGLPFLFSSCFLALL